LRLSSKSSYLVSRPVGSSTNIAIYPTLSPAILCWDARTRVSPLYGVSSPAVSSPTEHSFAGSWTLLFFGPCSPAKTPQLVGRLSGERCLWLTQGAFNHIIAIKSAAAAKVLISRLDRDRIRWELWPVRNGDVGASLVSNPVPRESSWRQGVANLRGPARPVEFPHIVDEYRALLSSALARASDVLPSYIEDLISVHDAVAERLRLKSSAEQNKTRSLLVDLNAGLSRFASQAFSGASPIRETECHFWTHSLLGAAIPLLALWQVRAFLTRTLGEYRIPDRVAGFSKITEGLPNLYSEYFSQDIIDTDWLSAAAKNLNKAASPLVRQIVYLSGRDGFKATESTLSAPLSTVTCCNCERWSLLTITHEVSHPIVHSVLSTLLPRRESDARSLRELKESVELYVGDRKPNNLLLVLRQFLLRAMGGLDVADRLDPHKLAVLEPPRLDDVSLRDLIDRRHEEVEELMVHAFDFIYFYGSDVGRYVPAIWRSWQSIPHLETRIRQYVLRTLATIATKFLTGPDPAKRAKESFESCLAGTAKKLGRGSYASAALKLLADDWKGIQIELAARILITQIVLGFLQGPEALEEVRRKGRPSRRKAADLLFSGESIRNPLDFIESETGDTVDIHRSFWMLQRLAFDGDEGV
jgi:hypothetical protein